MKWGPILAGVGAVVIVVVVLGATGVFSPKAPAPSGNGGGEKVKYRRVGTVEPIARGKIPLSGDAELYRRSRDDAYYIYKTADLTQQPDSDFVAYACNYNSPEPLKEGDEFVPDGCTLYTKPTSPAGPAIDGGSFSPPKFRVKALF